MTIYEDSVCDPGGASGIGGEARTQDVCCLDI